MTLIEYRREREEFDVNTTEEVIDKMIDNNGTIRFMNVMRWWLSRFNNGETDLFTWQAQQTKQLDLTANLTGKRFVPWYFHPISNEGQANNKKIDIQAHHVKRLYGVMMARILQGDTLVPNMYNTCSWFKHNAWAVDSMPQKYSYDLIWLLHFVDD